MWNFSPETIALKYTLPGHGKTLISISNDKDLKRMIQFHDSSLTVDVFVVMRDVIDHDVSSNMPAGRSSRTASISGEAVVPVDDAPVDGRTKNSVERDPVFDVRVPLESTAEHHRVVELENDITSVDQRITNLHESGEALGNYSNIEAKIRRLVALILMKHNDYVGARCKLLDVQTSYPGFEYIDELIKLCEIACIVDSQLQGSGIDWYSVLQANKTANESDVELKYIDMIRSLEPIKNKFPEIQSALGLIEKAYSVFSDGEKRYKFKYRRAASFVPCGSVKPLTHAEAGNITSEATPPSSSGTKRSVRQGSDKTNLICNSLEQPSKRVRSLGDDDCKIIAETQLLNKPIGNVCGEEVILDTAKPKTRLNEMEGSLGRSSGSPVEAMVHKEPKKAVAYKVGQFFAVYDQENMPRSYARIERIDNKKETNSTEKTLYLRWLRPAPINQDEKKWHQTGLPVSCGFFKLGSGKADEFSMVPGSPLVFSHLIWSFQDNYYSKELYQIYPRKGEVWALYKEWKPFDWCSDPKKRKGGKFLLVEVLSDYSTGAGVKVVSIVKVAGYKTIFRRRGLSSQIPARNLFGFSNNIPVRYAGNMRGLFSGKVLDLDSLSIRDDVVVDTVAAEFGHGFNKSLAGNV